jgi:hypothetical protein
VEGGGPLAVRHQHAHPLQALDDYCRPGSAELDRLVDALFLLFLPPPSSTPLNG